MVCVYLKVNDLFRQRGTVLICVTAVLSCTEVREIKQISDSVPGEVNRGRSSYPACLHCFENMNMYQGKEGDFQA